MKREPSSSGLPSGGKRPLIDGAQIEHAVADQQRRDAKTPPANLLTKMGAIRLLSGQILDRRGRGRTDPMIAQMLRELGVEITPETLRVYRGRLRQEDGEIVARASRQSPTPAAASAKHTQEVRAPSVAGGVVSPGDTLSSVTPQTQPSDTNVSAKPFSRTIGFDDDV